MLLAEYIGSFGIDGKGFVESFNLFQLTAWSCSLLMGELTCSIWGVQWNLNTEDSNQKKKNYHGKCIEGWTKNTRIHNWDTGVYITYYNMCFVSFPILVIYFQDTVIKEHKILQHLLWLLLYLMKRPTSRLILYLFPMLVFLFIITFVVTMCSPSGSWENKLYMSISFSSHYKYFRTQDAKKTVRV